MKKFKVSLIVAALLNAASVSANGPVDDVGELTGDGDTGYLNSGFYDRTQTGQVIHYAQPSIGTQRTIDVEHTIGYSKGDQKRRNRLKNRLVKTLLKQGDTARLSGDHDRKLDRLERREFRLRQRLNRVDSKYGVANGYAVKGATKGQLDQSTYANYQTSSYKGVNQIDQTAVYTSHPSFGKVVYDSGWYQVGSAGTQSGAVNTSVKQQVVFFDTKGNVLADETVSLKGLKGKKGSTVDEDVDANERKPAEDKNEPKKDEPKKETPKNEEPKKEDPSKDESNSEQEQTENDSTDEEESVTERNPEDDLFDTVEDDKKTQPEKADQVDGNPKTRDPKKGQVDGNPKTDPKKGRLDQRLDQKNRLNQKKVDQKCESKECKEKLEALLAGLEVIKQECADKLDRKCQKRINKAKRLIAKCHPALRQDPRVKRWLKTVGGAIEDGWQDVKSFFSRLFKKKRRSKGGDSEYFQSIVTDNKDKNDKLGDEPVPQLPETETPVDGNPKGGKKGGQVK